MVNSVKHECVSICLVLTVICAGCQRQQDFSADIALSKKATLRASTEPVSPTLAVEYASLLVETPELLEVAAKNTEVQETPSPSASDLPSPIAGLSGEAYLSVAVATSSSDELEQSKDNPVRSASDLGNGVASVSNKPRSPAIPTADDQSQELTGQSEEITVQVRVPEEPPLAEQEPRRAPSIENTTFQGSSQLLNVEVEYPDVPDVTSDDAGATVTVEQPSVLVNLPSVATSGDVLQVEVQPALEATREAEIVSSSVGENLLADVPTKAQEPAAEILHSARTQPEAELAQTEPTQPGSAQLIPLPEVTSIISVASVPAVNESFDPAPSGGADLLEDVQAKQEAPTEGFLHSAMEQPKTEPTPSGSDLLIPLPEVTSIVAVASAPAVNESSESVPADGATDNSAAEIPSINADSLGKSPASNRLELSLLTAIHIAMENSETLRVISGGANTTAAATVYDAPIENTGIQEEYGVFDTQFDWTALWTRIDQPSGLTEEGAFLRRNQLDRADVEASLTKRFFGGGIGAIEYDTLYSFFTGPNPGNFINPQYFTPLTFRFAQPLLQDLGRDVNLAPMQIARTLYDQSTWDFKQAALDSVRDVEIAYWQVYSAEQAIKALEHVIPLFEEIVRINRERAREEASAPIDADQAETNLWQAKRQLIETRLQYSDSLNLLRNLLNLPPSDRREIVLVPEPIDQKLMVNWQEAYAIAMQERPDVVRQRLAVRIRRLERLIAENEKKVRLDGVAAWRINGLGDDLSAAWSVLGDNEFTDWELGFQVSVPLGRNSARARLRQANLNYQRENALLNQTVHSALHDIAENLRNLNSLYEQIEAVKKEAYFADQWRKASRERYLDPALSGSTVADLNNYLQSLRNWAEATSDVANRIGEYNATLASLEAATGTLLDSRMIQLSFNCCHAATDVLAAEPFTPFLQYDSHSTAGDQAEEIGPGQPVPEQ